MELPNEYSTLCNRCSYFRQRNGRCIKARQCEPDEVFWAATGQCFRTNVRGPCPDGQLIVNNEGKDRCALWKQTNELLFD